MIALDGNAGKPDRENQCRNFGRDIKPQEMIRVVSERNYDDSA
jgi:hypothetical protein